MHIADENRYETSSKGKDEGKGDRERERKMVWRRMEGEKKKRHARKKGQAKISRRRDR